MSQVAVQSTDAESTESLPALIDRASTALASARTSAEVLEARDMARIAYDAAKSAGRMARAKSAHDEVIGAVYRAQADALLIESRAKSRLADEYDRAQAAGEVHKHGGQTPRDVGDDNIPSAADLGLRRDEIHEARRIRDAEAEKPGGIESALNEMVARGEEPTKARLRREIEPAPAAPAPEPADDVEAAERRKLAKLTREGLEDEVIGLRSENAELRAKIAQIKDERDRVKAQLAEATQSDMGRALGQSMRQRDTLKGRVDELMAKNVRQARRIQHLEKERDAARREIETQEIPLN